MCEKQCIWMTNIGCNCDNNNYETENQSLIENRNPESNQPMIKPALLPKIRRQSRPSEKEHKGEQRNIMFGFPLSNCKVGQIPFLHLGVEYTSPNESGCKCPFLTSDSLFNTASLEMFLCSDFFRNSSYNCRGDAPFGSRK